MSVKQYGIYLAYAPMTDLRGQGLGRHLANMLRGAESRGDVRFVLACPGWMLPELQRLFVDEGVSTDACELITTNGIPFSLRLYLMARWFKNVGKNSQSGDGWKLRPKDGSKLRLRSRFKKVSKWLFSHILATRNPAFVLLFLPLAIVLIMPSVFIAFARNMRSTVALISKGIKHIGNREPLSNYLHYIDKLEKVSSKPQSISLVFQAYQYLEVKEINLLVSLINKRHDINAWYSPTAFWPEFNKICGPKLMCVPDVVLSDFPSGFALEGDDRMTHAFTRVELAVRGADHYVTYSQDVKWHTLVRRYHVDPQFVHVIPHGNNSLAEFLAPEINQTPTFIDEDCWKYLREAIQKSSEPEYTNGFTNMQFGYIFYASQFRPNKNVLTLLRAYEWLLRHRYVGVKLILTGNIGVMPDIRRFIEERGLNKDVLCLRGLSVRQLAACYRLARLAVNPSLSEGGFPFTFDEALSVETPVVMARIGVTEEVITDPELQADMLFDPYDWHDMAHKIEWALANRAQLYQKQKSIYGIRSQRTWAHVVDDYVSLLDQISSEPDNAQAVQP